MKPLKTKAEIRAELDQQIQDYLQQGGEVRGVPAGASGRNSNENPFASLTPNQPPQTRTPLVELVKEIEARKHPPKAPLVNKGRRQPRRVLVKDDFGEPVRWVWEE